MGPEEVDASAVIVQCPVTKERFQGVELDNLKYSSLQLSILTTIALAVVVLILLTKEITGLFQGYLQE